MAIMTGVQSPNILGTRPEYESKPVATKQVLTSKKVDIDFVR
jgi:hypothetical protein